MSSCVAAQAQSPKSDCRLCCSTVLSWCQRTHKHTLHSVQSTHSARYTSAGPTPINSCCNHGNHSRWHRLAHIYDSWWHHLQGVTGTCYTWTPQAGAAAWSAAVRHSHGIPRGPCVGAPQQGPLRLLSVVTPLKSPLAAANSNMLLNTTAARQTLLRTECALYTCMSQVDLRHRALCTIW